MKEIFTAQERLPAREPRHGLALVWGGQTQGVQGWLKPADMAFGIGAAC